MASLLQKPLRGFLIVPEILRGCLLLDAVEFGTFRSYIKETSRAVRRVC
jgi:hypothetical protein